MRRLFCLPTVILLIFIIGCGHSLESRVQFQPISPTTGDSLLVKYFPGKMSPLADADSVLMQAQLYPTLRADEILLVEVAMQKRRGEWVAGISLKDSSLGCVLFQFTSGDSIDGNQDQAWDILIHTPDGRPVEGAYIALSRTFTRSFYMKRKRDFDKALEYLSKELKLHPENWRALSAGWSLKMRKARDDREKLNQIDAEVDSLLKVYPDEVDLHVQAFYYFDRRGNTARADELLNRLKVLDPDNKLFVWNKWSKIREIENANRRIKTALLFRAQVQDPNMLKSINRSVLSWMMGEEQWLKAVEFVNGLEDPDPGLLNQISWSLVEQNRMLLQAVTLAEKAVQRYRDQDDSNKPSYMPRMMWQKSREASLGNTLDTFAFALYKLGKLKEAEVAFQEAYELTHGSSAEITARYVQCLLDNNEIDKAITVATQSIEQGESNERINDFLRQAYKQKTGSSAPADSIITIAESKATKKLGKEIADRIIKNPESAPTFTLVTLDGDSISLESLRGKIVIVDFWATWCGPCKRSFPYLEKFWQQHRNDPDVMVLAINCWERKKGDAMVKEVRAFIEKNNYTFPVLLDMTDAVISKYGVEGIPTKFFIGQDGKIYFKDVGFSGPKMLQEMNLELQMLR